MRPAGHKYRWYNDYVLPDRYDNQPITVRLHANPEDAARKFNRTENVRAIPPTDPDFARLYPRRNDSESINRNLEDTLWLGRAHSIGHTRQLLNLLGYALMVNGLALHRPPATPHPARRLARLEREANQQVAKADSTRPHRHHGAGKTPTTPSFGGRRSRRSVEARPSRPGRRVFYQVFCNPRPRSSGDRASASGAVCAGSNPAEGATATLAKTTT